MIMRTRWLLITFAIILGAASTHSPQAAQEVSIAFIDVGQGDAVLIRDGAGFDILVDGGSKTAGQKVLDHLESAGVDDLEIILATHADRDHIGGLITVLESDELVVENIYFNGYPGNTLTWQEFETAAASDGLLLMPLQFPSSHNWGKLSVQVLNPPTDLVDPEQNDASVVLLIDYAQIGIFLPADIDTEVEQLLPGRTSSLQAEILKVSHHGSKFSTSLDFLGGVQPHDAIISVGVNSYGHPADETLQRLTSTETNIWRTDVLGTIRVIIDGTSYEILPHITLLPLILQDYNP